MLQWLYNKIEGYSPAYERDQLVSIVAVLLFICVNILAHIFFFVVFSITDVPEMRNMNIISIVLFFVILYLALFKYQFVVTCYATIALLCYYAVSCTYILGYNKNAVLLFPVMLFAVYTMFPFKRNHLNKIAGIIAIAYLLTVYLKILGNAKYIDQIYYIEYVNMIFAITSCLFIINVENLAQTFVNRYSPINKNILSKEAYQDFLTGLWNRRFMELEFDKISKGDRGIIVLADIDFFKKVNDTYGHNTGDHVLKKVSDIYRENLKETDVICRWGGEEFLFYLKNTTEYDAIVRLNKIRLLVQSTEFQYGKDKFNITVSFGLSVVDASIHIDKNIDRADKAMYYCKNNGRNLVATYKDYEFSEEMKSRGIV